MPKTKCEWNGIEYESKRDAALARDIRYGKMLRWFKRGFTSDSDVTNRTIKITDKVARYLSDASNGDDAKAHAEKFGLSVAIVRDFIQRKKNYEGKYPQYPTRTLAKNQYQNKNHDYIVNSEKSVGVLAQELGMKYNTVYQIRKRHNKRLDNI